VAGRQLRRLYDLPCRDVRDEHSLAQFNIAKWRSLFRRLDQAIIYLLIVATYTPCSLPGQRRIAATSRAMPAAIRREELATTAFAIRNRRHQRDPRVRRHRSGGSTVVESVAAHGR
jgi:hypothetical protein